LIEVNRAISLDNRSPFPGRRRLPGRLIRVTARTDLVSRREGPSARRGGLNKLEAREAGWILNKRPDVSALHPDPARSEHARQCGFTLLEIMVVVVLIAISATFAVISLDRDVDGIAELEARRFARLIAHARDESILSGRPFAVQVDPLAGSYVFFQYRDKWRELENDDVFRRRRFPEDLKIEFEIHNSAESSGLLVIEGLGEITPFILTVRGDKRLYRVSVDRSQNVVVALESDETA